MSASVSAPYWGELPPPKARRNSVNDRQTHTRRQSIDQQPPGSVSEQQPPNPNRISIQTTQSDAPTDSTLSPLASPRPSSFQPTGLAPRPLPDPHSPNYYTQELLEKRKRRSARVHEEYPQEAARDTPPAAPDVPSVPPVSYSPFARDRGSPYTFDASGTPGPPESALRAMAHARYAQMGLDNYHKDETPPEERQNRPPVLDRSRQRFDDGAGVTSTSRRASAPVTDRGAEKATSTRRASATNGHRHEADALSPVSPGRKDSLGTESRRKVWAADRSPLQKLELTLDSLTKDEKRARVEAAERRLRERTGATTVARPDADTSASQARPQARMRDRAASVGQDDKRRAIVVDTGAAQPSAAVRRVQPPQLQPAEVHRDDQDQPSPTSQRPITRRREVPAAKDATIPKRNLSFRERAAKNEFKEPQAPDEASPITSPVTPSGGGMSLGRSASNKLQKNPPGDPWHQKRQQAERRYQNIMTRGEQPEEVSPQVSTAEAGPLRTGGSVREAPPEPKQEHARDQASSSERYGYDGASGHRRGVSSPASLAAAAPIGPSRRPLPDPELYQSQQRGRASRTVRFPDQRSGLSEPMDYASPASSRNHGFGNLQTGDRTQPEQYLYRPPKYLDDWKTASVGTLSGALLDMTAEVPQPPEADDLDTAWWEKGSKQRRSSAPTRPSQPQVFDSGSDETQAHTRFNPPLYLKCGPLLRYCGIRSEKTPPRSSRVGNVPAKEVWRGTVMIVTQDSESSYDTPPTLRLFVQPIDLLPPPPAELRGGQALLPEYVDPIAGIPKLGRRGETFYVRPVEHLEEGKDVSMLGPDEGLFEIERSAPSFDDSHQDPPGSFTSRIKRIQVDGERLGKYKDVRGFRLHTERGSTFWRFNIEVELRDKQQRIAYRINKGPSTGFWVPARGQTMNIMFYSSNGFSLRVNPDELSGPDPMWRDVLNTHQTQPFHVMIGGGDQICNDPVMEQSQLFEDWVMIKNPLHKHNAPFTADLQNDLEEVYLERYCMWFSQGLFGLANSQIPMVNMLDDHDIIDGFGSYPDHFMKSPVFSGLGAVAFKYYMLFQHQTLMDEGEETEPSWALGCKPGPYIHELSRSLYISLGAGMALLAVDCRTERTRDDVVREDTWKKLIDRCYVEISKGQTKHLLVLLGVPIAYPRLVWLENLLTSRLMDPVKALGRAGLLGNFVNRLDSGVEVFDDIDDHWTAKEHKDERRFVIEDLQDLAADKSVRVTILSGDVHLAAIGQFYSNPKLRIAKHKDFRYMPNVVSSAVVNAPPPDMMVDLLNKRNKVHHFDKETDEDMIPIFTYGVDGKPRNNKRLLPHRNWCSIREYVPGSTPPATPPSEEYDYTPEATPPASRHGGGGSILRRLSLSRRRGPAYRPDASPEKDRSRPPVSSGFLRTFSRRASSAGPEGKPQKLSRSLSLDRAGDDYDNTTNRKRRKWFGIHRPSTSRPDDGGINGNWGDSDEDIYEAAPTPPNPNPTHVGQGPSTSTRGSGSVGLRGGAADPHAMNEYTAGDDQYFTAHRPPRRAFTQPATQSHSHSHSRSSVSASQSQSQPSHSQNTFASSQATVQRPNPLGSFKRTPTGLSARHLRKHPQRYEVDLQGGIEITLNVEVNARDPAGITVPYRLLVPKLEYEYEGEEPEPVRGPGSLQDDDMEGTVRTGETSNVTAVEEPEYGLAGEHGYDGAGRFGQESRIPGEPVKKEGALKRWFSGRRGGGGGSRKGSLSQRPYPQHPQQQKDRYEVPAGVDARQWE